ncbi:hypothetical protein DFH07DRAFT_1032245 [Mycena maculata]|uniref:Uncharacterized protein n=1 Tax=Mycena maculata TaxID=230809 RepID=A0AAD7IZB0_9AGAR|nr:hypothetical protein DFH07DRAFT_1032245 [Mycena maculata]
MPIYGAPGPVCTRSERVTCSARELLDRSSHFQTPILVFRRFGGWFGGLLCEKHRRFLMYTHLCQDRDGFPDFPRIHEKHSGRSIEKQEAEGKCRDAASGPGTLCLGREVSAEVLPGQGNPSSGEFGWKQLGSTESACSRTSARETDFRSTGTRIPDFVKTRYAGNNEQQIRPREDENTPNPVLDEFQRQFAAEKIQLRYNGIDKIEMPSPASVESRCVRQFFEGVMFWVIYLDRQPVAPEPQESGRRGLCRPTAVRFRRSYRANQKWFVRKRQGTTTVESGGGAAVGQKFTRLRECRGKRRTPRKGIVPGVHGLQSSRSRIGGKEIGQDAAGTIGQKRHNAGCGGVWKEKRWPGDLIYHSRPAMPTRLESSRLRTAQQEAPSIIPAVGCRPNKWRGSADSIETYLGFRRVEGEPLPMLGYTLLHARWPKCADIGSGGHVGICASLHDPTSGTASACRERDADEAGCGRDGPRFPEWMGWRDLLVFRTHVILELGGNGAFAGTLESHLFRIRVARRRVYMESGHISLWFSSRPGFDFLCPPTRIA